MPARARARVRTRKRARNGGVAALAENLRKAKSEDRIVKVGLPSGSSPYPDGTSVIMVGAVHEFGAPDQGIPERSWMRSALRGNRRDLVAMTQKLAKRVQDGDLSMTEALELLGTKAASMMQGQIVDVSSPPNAPQTIARKGSSNPLIDTGHLRQAVTYQVVKGGA